MDSKKSFVLYSDQRGLFDKLDDSQAGRLIKHIFSYVNNESADPDFVTELAFESIKQQLKRDLIKWEKQLNQRRDAGKKSAESRKRNKELVDERSTKSNERSISSTDNVTVNVTDNVTVTDIKEDIYPFEDFWNLYGNKTGRHKCELKWNKISDEDKVKIKETLKGFLDYKPFKDYTHPNPLTYLNGSRWNDEVKVNKQKSLKPPKPTF